MNVDPSINVVVFAVGDGKGEPFVGQGLTQAADCIKNVWLDIQRQHGIRPNDVREIYSEWQPSPEDMSFLDATFPSDLKLSYSFKRPADGNWDRAFADVKAIIAKSLEAKQAAQQPGPLLIPVLRNIDDFTQMVVHRRLIPELGIFLASVGPTPRGTIGIDYLMSAKARSENMNLNALWNEAFSNLKMGLNVSAAGRNNERYFIVKRQGNIASSALALPDFFEQAMQWVGNREIQIAVPDPDTLLLCAARSPVARDLKNAALQSQYVGAVHLTPCVLLLENGKLSLQAKRISRPG
jgi:hypothetical protein